MRRISGILIACAMAQLVPHITFSLPDLMEEAVDNILARMNRVTSAATARADQHMEFLASLRLPDGSVHSFAFKEVAFLSGIIFLTTLSSCHTDKIIRRRYLSRRFACVFNVIPLFNENEQRLKNEHPRLF